MYPQAHVEVDGARLYCELAGAGPAVVFIHGFTLDTRMRDDQFMPLAQHFQVVRYDMRGFGRSTLPAAALYAHVHDLSAMLDRLNIGQAYLVGLSLGGGVALDFALAYPQRTVGLVIIDTTLGGYQWSPAASALVDLIWQEARRRHPRSQGVLARAPVLCAGAA